MKNLHSPTILVFDSGVGGISVYLDIKKQLPNADYIYLFDNEAYPYGELEQTILIERVEKLILHAVEKHWIDIVVIACNTASTIVLPNLREKLQVPVVGVVPAIKPASSFSKKAIGLIATPATIKREYTHQLIKDFSLDKTVELIGSTELVDMAEGKLRGHSIEMKRLEEILKPLINTVDVVVLGCTHFPLIKQEIALVLGQDVKLIDSGEAIARRVASLVPYSANKGRGSRCKIYSSAAPKEEAALNITLSKIGFETIEMLLNLDA